MTDQYSEDDGDEFFEGDIFDFLRWHMQNELEIANGDFRLVLEDEIIFGLCYAEALDRAKEAIAAAGYGKDEWDSDEDNWTVEYYVGKDGDFELFATVESEQS